MKSKPSAQHKKEFLKKHLFENKGSSGLGGQLWLKPNKTSISPSTKSGLL